MGELLEIASIADADTDESRAHLAAVRDAWRGVADRATRVLGAGSPKTLQIHHMIGRALDLHGNSVGEARAMLEGAIEASVRELGRNHPITLEGVRHLSTVLRDDPQAVVDLVEPWLPEFDGLYGPLSPPSANIRNNLGWTLHQLGRSEEALPLLRTARDGTFASFGPRNSFSTWVETTLLGVTTSLGLMEESEAILVDRWARWAPFAAELDEQALRFLVGQHAEFVEVFGREPAIDPEHLRLIPPHPP